VGFKVFVSEKKCLNQNVLYFSYNFVSTMKVSPTVSLVFARIRENWLRKETCFSRKHSCKSHEPSESRENLSFYVKLSSLVKSKTVSQSETFANLLIFLPFHSIYPTPLSPLPPHHPPPLPLPFPCALPPPPPFFFSSHPLASCCRVGGHSMSASMAYSLNM
jgi:hypothetical protein